MALRRAHVGMYRAGFRGVQPVPVHRAAKRQGPPIYRKKIFVPNVEAVDQVIGDSYLAG
jgi:hypothetical protein